MNGGRPDVSRRFAPASRQHVLAALARMEVSRGRLANDVAHRASPGARIVAVATGPSVSLWLTEAARSKRSLRTALAYPAPDEVGTILKTCRDLADGGTAVTSVWDVERLPLTTRLTLVAEDAPGARFGFVPAELQFVDGNCVVLDGPVIRGGRSFMAVSDPEAVRAAQSYWDAVMSTSYACAEELAVVEDLSRRQIRVLALMVTTRSDEKIAAQLRCSLRTVRSDVAQVLSVLDVQTRFAAGVRIAELLGGPSGWPVAS